MRAIAGCSQTVKRSITLGQMMTSICVKVCHRLLSNHWLIILYQSKSILILRTSFANGHLRFLSTLKQVLVLNLTNYLRNMEQTQKRRKNVMIFASNIHRKNAKDLGLEFKQQTMESVFS